jgi:membrane-bound serine protease (ClpP class)
MSALTLALVSVGLLLLVIEAHAPTYGVVGAAGVAAILGALALAVLGTGGSLLLALALGVPVAAAASGLGALAVRKARAATRTRARCGAEGLVGRVGVVRRPLEPTGQVLVDGALWRARRSWADDEAEPPPAAGDTVVVDRVQGLTLTVRRADPWEVDP